MALACQVGLWPSLVTRSSSGFLFAVFVCFNQCELPNVFLSDLLFLKLHFYFESVCMRACMFS